MKRSELTEEVLAYQIKPPDPEVKRQLINKSLEYIFHTLRPQLRGDEEAWQDYLGESIPRIEKAIEQFRDKGKDFEAYLSTCIRYHMRTYQRERAELNAAFQLVPTYSAGYETEGVADKAWAVQEFPFKIEQCIDNSRNWDFEHADPLYRRIIIYVLKYSASVSERFLAIVALRTKVSLEWLLGRRTEILNILQPVHIQHQCLLDEAAHFLARLHVLHRKALPSKQLRLGLKPNLCEEEAFVRRRMKNLNRRIQNLRLVPHHHALARVLGLPKGTIDSSLYYLKIYWDKAEPVIKEMLEQL